MNRNRNTTSLELDAETANLLTQIAEAWGVSGEEAVRRALDQVNVANGSSGKQARWEALKALQRSLNLTPTKAAAWQEAITDARR
ncbi:MAG TPA: hypothetical protein VGW36_06790 [Pyrinomonadaceae bacterium]|nr:hypothetical protein [Pyrinomonadaceae bacterium]